MTRMLGAVLRAYGDDFEIEELEIAAPKDDEVLIKLVATGFCHTDEKVRAGDKLELEINQLLAGRSLEGIVQGDSDPQQLIPMLVDKVRHDELPLDKLITEYPLERTSTMPRLTRPLAERSSPCRSWRPGDCRARRPTRLASAAACSSASSTTSTIQASRAVTSLSSACS